MFIKRAQHVLIMVLIMMILLPGMPVAASTPGETAKEYNTSIENLQPSVPDMRFAVIGDYGYASQPELDVANLVKSWNPDFVITVGDNNYELGSAATIDQNIGQYYHEFIHPYTGSYGAGAATNLFFPSLGNHDWETTNAQPYLDYFALPGNERYYDYVMGPVHFFVIDSDVREPDGINSSSTQALWLKNALSASTSDWNLVYFHHSPYSSGAHGSNSTLQWPFALWGADAVLTGHDHGYERILQNGIPYFVNGIGGKSLYPFITPVSGSQVRYSSDYGAMLVAANGTTIKFQAFTRNGVLIDEYILDKSFPSVVSILRQNANSTSAANVDFKITFSEPVTGVDIGDMTLVTTGVTGAGIPIVSGLGNTYTVTVNTGSGNGTIRLDLVDDDSIAGLALTPLGGAGVGNGDFIGGETYTVIKSATFNDVPLTYWANGYIERLYNAGITSGCSTTPLNYCPDISVTRAQMAIFILRGIHGSAYIPPAATGTVFTDVPLGSFAADWIEQLALEGISSGCGSGIYCPSRTVTRAEMSIFLLRGEHGNIYTPPAATGAVFSDVPLGSFANAWIEQLALEGITSGCSGGNYCPGNSVTRAEMAVFLVRAFNLP